MECGKLTAKLRDAVPVCFIENGKEIKRFKNIEIPDEIKKLPFISFEFSVPMTGAITFKIMFEQGTLPMEWPEVRQRKARKRTAPGSEKITKAVTTAIQQAAEEGEPVEEILEAAKQGAEIIEIKAKGHELVITASDPTGMEEAFKVTGDRRKALVDAISDFTGQRAIYQNAPSFAYVIGEYRVDKNGTLTGEQNEPLIAALQAKGFTAE